MKELSTEIMEIKHESKPTVDSQQAEVPHITYYAQLDGLRAVAVFLVVLFHATYAGWGWMGVQLFFVLSGYLITRILVEQKAASSNRFFINFFGRRALRIFPLYFGYLLLISAVYVFSAQNLPYFSDAFSWSWPYLFTYTYNLVRLDIHWLGSPYFSHVWSLCVEEHFYLFWPLVIYFFPVRWLKIFVVGLLFLAPLVRAGFAMYGQHKTQNWHAIGDSTYWFSLSHFDAFACGACIVLFQLQRIRYTMIYLLLLLVLFLGLGGYILWPNYLKLFPKTLGYPFPLYFFYQHIWGYTIINMLATALIIWLLQQGKGSRILALPVFVSIGKISYGIYIFHQGLLYLYKSVFPHHPRTIIGIMHFLCYCVLLYGISYILFHYYEKRFLLWKDKYFPLQK